MKTVNVYDCAESGCMIETCLYMFHKRSCWHISPVYVQLSPNKGLLIPTCLFEVSGTSEYVISDYCTVLYLPSGADILIRYIPGQKDVVSQ